MGKANEEAERLFEIGEGFADAQEDKAVLRCFRAAWDALPEPRDEQGPAIRILAAVADCHFHLSRWDECRAAIQHSFRCGADVANPFLRLRLGEALYDASRSFRCAEDMTAGTETRLTSGHWRPRAAQSLRNPSRPRSCRPG
jgi:hypothetical protein